MKRNAMDAGDSRLANAILVILYTLFALLCAYPFYYVMINSISQNDLVSRGAVMFLPTGVHIDNYISVFQLRGLGQATLVSLTRTVLGTAITVMCTSFLGYLMSRREMWAHKFWYRFIIATMYFNSGLIPWFILMKNLGMINNFFAYILPSAVAPFNMVLYKTYAESVPASLEESAQLDGAGYITRFIRIMFPVTVPIVATIAIFSAVGQWNSFMDTLYLMTRSNLYTLQFILYQYLNEAEALAMQIRQDTSMAAKIDWSSALTATSVRMTITVVVILPITIVYPIFQNYFIGGIMVGAIKG